MIVGEILKYNVLIIKFKQRTPSVLFSHFYLKAILHTVPAVYYEKSIAYRTIV